MSVWIIVPCYNEAERLDSGRLAEMLVDDNVNLMLVDDGSRDGTAALLERMAREHGDRVRTLILQSNEGKGEAVRRGMLECFGSGVELIGFADADLATPPVEMLRLVEIAKRAEEPVVMGSRVKLLGRDIQRKLVRHYLGRVFATAASTTLHLPVYDTQCGAKIFRASPELRRALTAPFRSSWIFDVELIARLLYPPSGPGFSETDFIEVPLEQWHDVAGSKLRFHQVLRVGWDLVRIAAEVEKHRRRA